jgi:hypothetical protein
MNGAPRPLSAVILRALQGPKDLALVRRSQILRFAQDDGAKTNP